MGDGWAQELLAWRAGVGRVVSAEISAGRYFIRADRHEAIAHAEVRDVGGRRRVEIGSFRTVGEARAACERMLWGGAGGKRRSVVRLMCGSGVVGAAEMLLLLGA
jgi:hypothetical protein